MSEMGVAEFKKRLREMNLSVEEISKALGVSKHTAERWLDGTTAPHSIMRPAVFEILDPIVAKRKSDEEHARNYREHFRWAQKERKDDPRYKVIYEQFKKVKSGYALRRVFDMNQKGQLVYDDANYKDGKYCPLAVALGVDHPMGQGIAVVNDRVVSEKIAEHGFNPRNLKGVEGKFYRDFRKEDLEVALEDVLKELGEWCSDFFHHNMCSGFGGPNYCGRCGKTWRW